MVFREITLLSLSLRLLLALILSGIIGLEREKKNRPAGLRTYMLVCLGSCLIMLTNQYIYQTTGAGDPMRLGAQVVSGIGFLGAGTIIVTKRNQIKGLTTAAGLWSSAGIGLALGVGFYEGAILCGLMIFLILSVLHRYDDRMHRRAKRMEIYLEYDANLTMGAMVRTLRTLDLTVEGIQPEHDSAVSPTSSGLILSIKLKKPTAHADLIAQVLTLPGVLYAEEL